MLRKMLAFTLSMVFFTTCASAAVLVMDTRTYPEAVLEEGVIQLQWDGFDLPKGTAYELVKTEITDGNCIIGKCEEPFQKFAQIAYTDETGEQLAWVMAYDLNRAFEGDYGSEKAAESYAQRFFSNQYVQAATENTEVNLKRTPDGWQAELMDASGKASHRLCFTENGTILSYRDLSFTLPSLAGGAEHVDELGNAAHANGSIGMLEWMSRELLPNMSFQSIATFAHDEEKNVYSFNADRGEHFISVAVEPELHITAYTAMVHPSARYGEYLTSAEACAIGRKLLVASCGLTPEEADLCTIRQTEFNTWPGTFGSVEITEPYWYVWFSTPDGENYAEFDIMIDAATGEGLYAGGPITGNG